ncbi:MAG: hypothetical protein HY897_13825 [Deltaproteobacteria bacterium]|nr:hypothetical protein [Deltaproteobacteria bacterium]
MYSRQVIVVMVLVLAGSTAFAAGKQKEPAEAAPVSEGEMKKTAAEVKKHGDDVVKSILGLLDEARKEKDVVKADCVSEKLAASKELVLITGRAEIALRENLGKKEMASARHEYEKIDIARGRLKALALEAQACVGVTYTGETKLEVEEPKDLPEPPTPGKSPTSPVLPPGGFPPAKAPGTK